MAAIGGLGIETDWEKVTSPGVMVILYISIGVCITQVYVFAKTHQMINLESVHCIICKFYFEKIHKQYWTVVNDMNAKVLGVTCMQCMPVITEKCIQKWIEEWRGTDRWMCSEIKDRQSKYGKMLIVKSKCWVYGSSLHNFFKFSVDLKIFKIKCWKKSCVKG